MATVNDASHRLEIGDVLSFETAIRLYVDQHQQEALVWQDQYRRVGSEYAPSPEAGRDFVAAAQAEAEDIRAIYRKHVAPAEDAVRQALAAAASEMRAKGHTAWAAALESGIYSPLAM